MFDFIKKLFSSTPKYGMGSIPSPADPRNIQFASVSVPLEIPSEYESELPPVEDQGQKGKCVGCGLSKLMELNLTKEGQPWVDLSDDDLYEQCKLIDGIPEIQGTFPAVGAKVACGSGVATVDAYKTGNQAIINASRALNKMQGYAFVNADFDSICQAIYQKKAIGASFSVDTNWFIGKIMKVLQSIGRHYIVLKGYQYANKSLKGQNSWGIRWIGYIAGLVNTKVKKGCFEVLWDDVSGTIGDLITFTYIPPKILEDVKNTGYRFTTTMRIGSSGYEVKKLQEKLGIIPSDGKFGKMTQQKVIEFQTINGLTADGIIGPACRAKLNVATKSFIPQWANAIKEHEGFAKGTRSWRNNSPANFKSGTLTAYMKKLGATGVDKDGFAIFPTLAIGEQALVTFLTDACSDRLKVYRGTMTISEAMHVYAPMSENDTEQYVRQVTRKMGVDRSLQIKELL